MSFAPITADEIRAAQILTGATMALWIIVGLTPGVQAYATPIRAVTLVLYLVGCVAFAIYTLVLT